MTARRIGGSCGARRGGFTLLEVMVAMAILASLLTGITLSVQRSVQASHHARLMSSATYLCRQRMVQLEEEFIVNGFTDSAGGKEDKGQFDEPYKTFRWAYRIEQIRLPSTEQIQSAATKAVQDKQQAAGSGSGGGLGGLTGSGSGSGSGSGPGAGNPAQGMGPMVGPVKDMLEQGIRKVTLRVLWDEPGRPDQQVEVVSFYTDMRRIPLAGLL